MEVGEKVKGAACVDKRKHSVCTTLLSRAGRECAPGRGRKGLVYQAKECRLGYRKGNREPLNQFKERKDMVRLCLKSHSDAMWTVGWMWTRLEAVTRVLMRDKGNQAQPKAP